MSDIETHPLPPFLPPNAKSKLSKRYVADFWFNFLSK